jgi:hypothetical protein
VQVISADGQLNCGALPELRRLPVKSYDLWGHDPMEHTQYYLIEPRPDAASRLRERGDPDFADILLEPVLISSTRGGRTIWQAEDHALRIKLLYLAAKREHPGPFASDEDARKWLGSDQVSGAVFDQWWTVRPLVLEGSDRELLEFLKPVKERILPTGNSLVDEWVEWTMKLPGAPPQVYKRFRMLNDAWTAAMRLVNDRGDLRLDLQRAETRFLKWGCCLGLPEEECRTAFRTAVEIAQETIRFRRSNCGASSPKPARRYELLRSLAEVLEARFPSKDAVLVMAGCKLLEMHWDR